MQDQHRKCCSRFLYWPFSSSNSWVERKWLRTTHTALNRAKISFNLRYLWQRRTLCAFMSTTTWMHTMFSSKTGTQCSIHDCNEDHWAAIISSSKKQNRFFWWAIDTPIHRRLHFYDSWSHPQTSRISSGFDVSSMQYHSLLTSFKPTRPHLSIWSDWTLQMMVEYQTKRPVVDAITPHLEKIFLGKISLSRHQQMWEDRLIKQVSSNFVLPMKTLPYLWGSGLYDRLARTSFVVCSGWIRFEWANNADGVVRVGGWDDRSSQVASKAVCLDTVGFRWVKFFRNSSLCTRDRYTRYGQVRVMSWKLFVVIQSCRFFYELKWSIIKRSSLRTGKIVWMCRNALDHPSSQKNIHDELGVWFLIFAKMVRCHEFRYVETGWQYQCSSLSCCFITSLEALQLWSRAILRR